MTEQNAFEKARQENEALKKNAENKGFVREFDDIHYLGLKNKQKTDDYFSAFRILSGPVQIDRSPTDCKTVFRSDIATDKQDGSYFECNWPQELDSQDRENGNIDKSWILNNLFEEIMKGTWYTDDKGDNKKDFFYKDTEVFKRVHENKIYGWEKKFRGSRRVMMNVLDKMDLDFHRKFSKAKFLASSHEKSKKSKDPNNPVYYTTRGVPYVISKNASGFYDILWDRVVGTRGNWDIDIIAYLDGMRYEIFDATDIISNPKYENHPVRPFISDQPLEDEFKNLELYDFDKLFRPTSYSKLKRNLTNLFKDVDRVCNTKLYEKLCDLAAEEKKHFQELEKEQQNNVAIQKNKDIQSSQPNQEEKSDALNVRRRSTAVPQETNSSQTNIDIEIKCKEWFPKWDELPSQDKKMLLDNIVKFEDNGVIVWNPSYPQANIYPCSEENCKIPNTSIPSSYPIEVSMCPRCGAKFDMGT